MKIYNIISNYKYNNNNNDNNNHKKKNIVTEISQNIKKQEMLITG